MPSQPPADVSALRAAIVRTLLRQVGKPYVWGAAGPNSFDCSGLGMYAYEVNGVSIPHNSVAQYDASKRVSAPDLADPVFLNFDQDGPQHVVWAIGGGQVIAAPHTGALVQRQNLSDFAGNHAYGTFLGGGSGSETPPPSSTAPGAPDLSGAAVGCATLVVQALMVAAVLAIGLVLLVTGSGL